MNAEDLKRTEELKARIWAHKARRMLHGASTPDIIRKEEIESHKGRIGKALTLLDDYVTYAGTTKESTFGSTVTNYRIKEFEESKAIAVKPSFSHTWITLHTSIFPVSTSIDQNEFDTHGYQDINKMFDTKALYVYWHQEEYHIIKVGGSLMVMQKDLMIPTIKMILRATVEQKLQDDFTTRLEQYLSLPAGSVKDDNTFMVHVRGFSAYAYRFTHEAYYGAGGFMEEYQHFQKYFEALSKTLTTLNTIIEQHGGHAAIIEEMRKKIIADFIDESPMYLNKEKEDKDEPYYSHLTDRMKKSYKSPVLNTFIIRNAVYFDYEVLYGEDKSIVNLHNTSNSNQDSIFTPDDKELSLIKSTETERTPPCLLQMISDLSQRT